MALEGRSLQTLDLLEQVIDHAILILSPHFYVMMQRLNLAILDRFQGAIALLCLERVVELSIEQGDALSDI